MSIAKICFYKGAYVKGICAIDIVKEKFINHGKIDYKYHIYAVGRLGSPAMMLVENNKTYGYTIGFNVFKFRGRLFVLIVSLLIKYETIIGAYCNTPIQAYTKYLQLHILQPQSTHLTTEVVSSFKTTSYFLLL